ncbi:hypothetical protein BD289DRAFT_456936 [Coniella lustricola]|uniref:Uncharacterized protein n=1 Tax=Coniella lustricola TaxID=2025994 RepID=A0A2T2ZTW0_9PEZI|nr:hypothetical protein BD289DRAFT_456936 [Coniella lustricola]
MPDNAQPDDDGAPSTADEASRSKAWDLLLACAELESCGYTPADVFFLPPIFPTQFHSLPDSATIMDDRFAFAIDSAVLIEDELKVMWPPPALPLPRMHSADLKSLLAMYVSAEMRKAKLVSIQPNALFGYWQVDAQEWHQSGHQGRVGRVLLRYRAVELVIWTDETHGRFCLGTRDLARILTVALEACRSVGNHQVQADQDYPPIFCDLIAGRGWCVRQRQQPQPPVSFYKYSNNRRLDQIERSEAFAYQWCLHHPSHMIVASDVQQHRTPRQGGDFTAQNVNPLPHVQLLQPGGDDIYTVWDDPLDVKGFSPDEGPFL